MVEKHTPPSCSFARGRGALARPAVLAHPLSAGPPFVSAQPTLSSTPCDMRWHISSVGTCVRTASHLRVRASTRRLDFVEVVQASDRRR